MGKYENILICTDLDGTLCDNEGNISKENQEAIEYFKKEGGYFTICTGRSAKFIRDIEKKGLKINAPLICLNGAMIYDIENDKILYKNPIKKEKLSDYEKFYEENKIYLDTVYYHTYDTFNDYSQVGDNELYKIVFAVKKGCVNDIRKNLEKKYSQDFFITNSWHTGVELMDKDSTKGVCVKKFLELFDKSIEKTVCVGDFENDISMLKIADISYAVSNAIDDVKKVAKKVTVSNEESAIAKIIMEL